MTNTIINYITTIITTIIVNQEFIQAGISFFRLPVRMPLIITQTVRETITAGLVCAAALLLLWYMALNLYRTYQGLCKQRNSSQQQPPVSILRRSGGSSHRKNNRTYWFGAALFRTPNRVHFAPFFQKRTFVPDEQELQSLREHFGQIRWQIVFQRVLKQLVFKCVLNELRSKVEKIVVASTLSNPQCISKATRSILTKLKIKAAKAKRKQKEFALKNHRQLLQTVLDDMLSNIPVPMDLDDAGNVEPNDMQDEEPILSLKRTATYSLVSSRPTKRRKLNSSMVPSSATAWAKQINERFTPLLPVIIEDPEEEDIIMSTIDLSLGAGLIDDNSNSDVSRGDDDVFFPMNKKEEDWDRLKYVDWNSLEHAPPTSTPTTPPVSILRPGRKDWGSPRTTNRVSFTLTNRRRNFMPDQEDIQSRKNRIQEIYSQIKYHELRKCFEERLLPQLWSTLMAKKKAKRKVKKKAKKKAKKKTTKVDFKPTLPVITEDPEEEDENHFDLSLDTGLIKDIEREGPSFALARKNHRQMLCTTVLHDMLSNIPLPMNLDDDGDNEPNVMQDKAPRLSLKRTATYCPVAPRPTKRRKLNSSTVPSSATEWAKRINERFTPLLPVIIEHPEEQEQDNFIDIESSLDAELIDDSIDSAEDPLEDTISDDEILAPPPEQSDDNTATIDIPPDGMGSGWTESGKRYSLRLAKLLIPHAEDPFTEALGSGMTEQEGRRYSHRVANRRSGTN